MPLERFVKCLLDKVNDIYIIRIDQALLSKHKTGKFVCKLQSTTPL